MIILAYFGLFSSNFLCCSVAFAVLLLSIVAYVAR